MFGKMMGMFGSLGSVRDTSGGSSKVRVDTSSNGSISAQNSTVDVRGSSNFQIAGEHHRQITLQSSSNINVGGRQSDVNLGSCSNVTITGSNSGVRLRSSSSVMINGDQNDVQAERASNLIVEGNGNRVNANNISNHTFLPTQANKNVFEVACTGTCFSSGLGWNGTKNSGSTVTVKGFTISNLASLTGSVNCSYSVGSDANGISLTKMKKSWIKKFTVEYANSARVTGPLYEVGIFRFHVNMNNPDYLDITVDSASTQVVTVTTSPGGHAVEIEGLREADAENVQILELRGPSLIELFSPTNFRMYLPPFLQ